jgi:sarcosine oxidase
MAGMDIAVVGLGAAGLGAALAAAEAGHRVIGFEQYDLDHQPASSGGRGKIIRFGYGDPFYADLMRTTYPRWQQLTEQTGRTLMSLYGGLHVGPAEHIAVVARGIEDAGHEVYDGHAYADSIGVRIPAGEAAIFEPTAGVMWPSQARAALAEAARSAGADLREHAQVQKIDPDPARPVVRTADGSFEFDRVIVAGGPWAFRLAPQVAGWFVITRRFQVVFGTDRPLGDGRPHPWIDHADPGFYGMTNVDEGIHLIGLHRADLEQVVDDPDEPDDEATRAWSTNAQLDYLVQRFGIDRPTPLQIRACHYTSTRTDDFVIDECPGAPGVILVSACSGHGFKFAITSGAYAAALAQGRDVPDRDRFRLDRVT